MKTFGEIIKTKREEQNLLLREVSALTSIDQSIISKFEKGERKPSREQVLKFAEIYNLSQNDLIAQANKLPMNKQKEYNTFKVQFESEFKKALPYLEKAHEIKPKDRNTILSLRELYTQIKETAKADEMTKLLGN